MTSADLEVQFLREIVKSPEDDLALLAYCDWLQEQPAPELVSRGRYLRLVQQGRRPGYSGFERRCEADALRREHERSWLGPLGDFIEGHELEGGFLSLQLSRRILTLAPKSPAAFDAWRLVRRLTFVGNASRALRFIRTTGLPPVLDHIGIERGSFDRGKALAAFREGLLAGVKSLTFRGAFATGEVLTCLQAGWFDGLTELILEDCSLGNVEAEALAAWPGLSSLRRLDLKRNRFGLDTIVRLVSSPFARDNAMYVFSMQAWSLPEWNRYTSRGATKANLHWVSGAQG